MSSPFKHTDAYDAAMEHRRVLEDPVARASSEDNSRRLVAS
jgi:hypothetical protein